MANKQRPQLYGFISITKSDWHGNIYLHERYLSIKFDKSKTNKKKQKQLLFHL